MMHHFVINLLPLFFVLIAAVPLLYVNRGRSLVFIFIIIVVSHLNIFPAINQLLYFLPDSKFQLSQLIVIVFFEIPLFLMLSTRVKEVKDHTPLQLVQKLPVYPPVLLLILLFIFWIVAILYDLFMARMYYQQFLIDPNAVPFILLYPYRLVVDSSFFVILYLIFALRFSHSSEKNRFIYKAALALYLGTFLAFFLLNSRMQFITLLICIYFVRPLYVMPRINLSKIFFGGVILGLLVLFTTLLRELYIENNNRLDDGDALGLFYGVLSMVVSRLDSLVMLDRLLEVGYNPFEMQLSGLVHVFNMYTSFFIDQQAYVEIRASEITSPSVEIVNRLLNVNYVDFPKSMVLDVQLTFGSLFLPLLAWFLSTLILFSQKIIITSNKINFRLLFGLFIIPLILQFGVETIGFISFILKWSPMLLMITLLHSFRRLTRKVVAHESTSLQPTAIPPQNNCTDV